MLIEEKVLKAGGPYRGVVLYLRAVVAEWLRPEVCMGLEAHGVHAHDEEVEWAWLPTVCKLSPSAQVFFCRNQSWGP